MEHVRRVALFAVVCALLGVVAASWLAPRFLSWNNSTGNAAAQCVCADLARQVADEVVDMQLKGGLGGAVVGLIAGVAFTAMRRKKPEAVVAPPA